MRIGEVADASGVPISTLRYYEDIGVLAAPKRINGRRDYDRAVLEKLRIIRRLQALGFNLTEIRAWLREDGAAWQHRVRERLHEVNQRIQHLKSVQHSLRIAMDCTCQSPATCENMR